MTSIMITNADRRSPCELVVTGTGVSHTIGPGNSVNVDLSIGDHVEVKVEAIHAPAVDADTFRARIHAALADVYEGAKEDGEKLTDEAVLLWHDAMHAIGITAPADPDAGAADPDEPKEAPKPANPDGDGTGKPEESAG